MTMKNLKTLAAVVALSAGFAGANAALAQTTTPATTDPAPTSCRPTDPCYDVLPSQSSVTNQSFDGTALSRLDLQVDAALNGVKAASTAVANSLKLEGRELDKMEANQSLTHGDVVAELNATLPSVVGDVDLSATAIGNTVSANVDAIGDIKVTQVVNRDPTAKINAYLGDIDGNVNIAATAMANNVSINGDFATAKLSQTSIGTPVIATASVGIERAAGAVDVAATAIGNSIALKGF
ncbi:hypothetical protein CSW63_16530 [Caulobacter sp. FWC26]|nr:hypothetical protein CSW63_16530 [Caulobacter sp. FWC26]